jgi:hypothetical protein
MSGITRATLEAIRTSFDRLDYRSLGEIYCDEGGEAFWEERRGPAQELGIQYGKILVDRLRRNGRSLFVGAGVSEIPVLLIETLELGREVVAFNLRAREVRLLNDACREAGFTFQAQDARTASGTFDHLWIVSVLNDPECFPEAAALSSGRANPVTFDPGAFAIEREAIAAVAAGCLEKLRRPGLVTTSVEEIPWIMDWCEQHHLSCTVEDEDYPTAIVGDPICIVRVEDSSNGPEGVSSLGPTRPIREQLS